MQCLPNSLLKSTPQWHENVCHDHSTIFTAVKSLQGLRQRLQDAQDSHLVETQLMYRDHGGDSLNEFHISMTFHCFYLVA